MNSKILVLSFFMIFTVPFLSVAGTSKSDSEKQEFDAYIVNSMMDKLSDDMQKEVKKKSKMSAGTLSIYGARIARASKWTEIEKETKIYRSWYVSIAKLCAAMGNLKNEYYTAKVNKDAELIQKCGTQYIEYRNKCIKLLENPPKIKKSQPKRRH